MMKNMILGSFIIISCLSSVLAQTVKVIDRSTLEPLEFVSVFNKNTQTVITTNAKGEFDLATFSGVDSLSFSLIGFQPLTISIRDIQASKYLVRLGESRIALNEVVVSANRWEQDKSEVAQKITSINPKEIAFQNPQTAADMLGASANVFIQKSQLGGGSPMIRGFATNRVLIVVDGVRMNNAIYRSGNLQNVISLDANALESAEVLFGPGSVIYGSDAIGGVMDFHTLSPKLATGEGIRFGGNALTRWSSANNEKTGHVDFNIAGQKWGFTTSITYSDFDDLIMGSNGPEEYLRPEYQVFENGKDIVVKNTNPKKQVRSGYHQWNLMQKIRFKPNNNWDINYGFHYSTTSLIPRYDRLIEYRNGTLRDGEWSYGPQQWMMNSLNITNFRESGAYDRARLTVALQYYQESRLERRFGRLQRLNRKEEVGALSVNLDFDKTLNEKTSVFYGLEGVYNEITSRASQRNIETNVIEPISTRYPNGSIWQSYAAYLNLKSNVSEQFTLLAGLRYTQFDLEAPFDNTFFPFPFDEAKVNAGALNGSLGLVFRPAKDWQFNLNASTGFRAPNVDDVGKVFDSAPGIVVVPNPDLESEYSYNIDLGIIKTITDRVKIDVTGFYTILDNAIVRRNFTFNNQDSILYDDVLSQVQALQNIAQANVYGVQAGLEAELSPNWSLASYLTWTKGEEEDEATGENVPLRHAPPLFGATYLNYEANRFRASLYAMYNSEVSNANLTPTEQAKPTIYAKDENGKPYSPAWFTLNFKASYQITPVLQLNVGLENILDERYRPYSSGIVAAGRNLILGLRGRF
ncbi:MAG: TonB-dependent receptor [Saprospiraceae bacterium]